jgi:hypothetical protein
MLLIFFSFTPRRHDVLKVWRRKLGDHSGWDSQPVSGRLDDAPTAINIAFMPRNILRGYLGSRTSLNPDLYITIADFRFEISDDGRNRVRLHLVLHLPRTGVADSVPGIPTF